MLPNPYFPADSVIFTEEFFHGKFNFLCSEDLEKDVRTLSLSVSICMKAKSG